MRKFWTNHTLRLLLRQCVRLVLSVLRTQVNTLPATDQAAILSKACRHCDCQMPDTAAFCPGCGRRMRVTSSPDGKVGFLPENLAGALTYVTFLPAVVFLLVDPYQRNRFVRFHSVQCLLAWGAGCILAIALKIAGLALFVLPMLGPLLVVLVDVVALLALILIWVVLVVKALQGDEFGLPLIGAIAERYADPL